MSTNATLAARFEEMASLLELTGANRFKVASYQKASRTLEAASEPLEPIATGEHAIDRLTELDGIGKGIAEKIVEFFTDGQIAELAELRAEVPAGLVKVMQVPGLGPKTVALLWKQLEVTDIDGLKRVIDDGSLAALPRMGAKSVEKIRASLAFLEDAGRRLKLGKAMPIAQRLVAELQALPQVERAAHAGSLRRGRETIGDIDLLAATTDPLPVHEAFRSAPGVVSVLASGETKSSVRIRLNADADRWGEDPDEEGATIQVDLRTLPPEHYGAALLYFTGSKEHNVRLRELALKKGCTLNEYGLYELTDDERQGKREPAPQKQGRTPVAAATEEAIYSALDIAWVPPELREDRGELERSAAEGPVRLLELDDIRSELHSHTTASDGIMELADAAARAHERGYHTLAITDHSKSTIGLSERKLRQHAERVRELNAELDGQKGGISLLAGSEVDILIDGSLDYGDPVLQELDIVVASPHVATDIDSAKATRRLLKAIEHPLVHILGHPTGRLIQRRRGMEPDMAEVLAAAAEHDVAVEINCHWMRLDLRDHHVAAAMEAGCLIAVNCDTHAPEDYDNLIYGVLTARRGGVTPERVINTWDREKLHAWLRRKR